MIILSGDKKTLLNLNKVERIIIDEKSDAALIIASYDNARPPVTLARYRTFAEAAEALENLCAAIKDGQGVVALDESTGPYIPECKRLNDRSNGRKLKRHGGT